MTVEQKMSTKGGGAAPLGPVVLDVVGCTLSVEEKELLRHPYIGGVIFFLRNFESPAQIGALIQEIRLIKPNVIIAVDQEGGRVQRFKNGFVRLPSLGVIATAYLDKSHALYQNDEFISELGWLMASELLAVGVDISFAPVIDADDDFSLVIGDRSFSKCFDVVSKLGALYMKGMHDAGMATTLKHFPGHGAVRVDSHFSLPIDSRKFEEVWRSDLIPFQNLLPFSEGVMPAHILFEKIDSASVGFSKFWIQDILRGKLNYKGVVFSDDLSMEGASIAGDHRERALAALRAGCDAVVVCNHPEKAMDILECLRKEQWPIDGRLGAMTAKNRFPVQSLSELTGSLRWDNIVKILHELEG